MMIWLFLSINNGEKKSVVREFMEEKGYNFTVLLDPDEEVSSTYAPDGIPVSYFVNKKAK